MIPSQRKFLSFSSKGLGFADFPNFFNILNEILSSPPELICLSHAPPRPKLPGMNTELVSLLADLVGRNDDLVERGWKRLELTLLNPACGWYFAKHYASARAGFPVTVTGRDQWLFRAYMGMLDSERWACEDLKTICGLNPQPAASAKLKALLIAGLGRPVDEHLDFVAERTGYPRPVVEGFEILFFNILDRPDDNMYLSSVVYPDGRFVEFDEHCFENTPLADLLLRAASNHRDPAMIARIAGLDDEECHKELSALPHRDVDKELEDLVMGNALLKAKTAMPNGPDVGIERALDLLGRGRASKRSARGTDETDSAGGCDVSAELKAALAGTVPPAPETGPGCVPARPKKSRRGADAARSGARLERFPEPVAAVWTNRDFDKEVMIVGIMSEPGLPDHYLTEESTGIPVSEVVFTAGRAAP